MRALSVGPRAALILGVLMGLPMAIVVPVAFLSIEPLNRFFSEQMSDGTGRQHAVGLVLMLAGLVMLPLGGALVLMPVLRSTRLGAGIFEHRSNLIIGSFLLFSGLYLWGMIFVDQLPCMMGVPNCD